MLRASAAGARLAHFPEGFLSGYAVEDVASWDGFDWASSAASSRMWPRSPASWGSGWCSGLPTR